MVDIKPIYLNKGYLFQNKIYYLDKIYLCFAKIKFSKHTLYRSSHPEVLCKVPQACNFIKKEALAQVFSREFCEIFKNNFFKKAPLVAASVL